MNSLAQVGPLTELDTRIQDAFKIASLKGILYRLDDFEERHNQAMSDYAKLSSLDRPLDATYWQNQRQSIPNIPLDMRPEIQKLLDRHCQLVKNEQTDTEECRTITARLVAIRDELFA